MHVFVADIALQIINNETLYSPRLVVATLSDLVIN